MHEAKNETKLPKMLFRPYGEYNNAELRAVKFRNDSEADRALELIGKSPTLKRMPFQFADGLTFIIPQEAVAPLRVLKLRFRASQVLEMGDLEPEEQIEIRRTQSL